MYTGIELIAAERKRQIEVEGWTPDNDDAHISGAMAVAAGCYALFADAFPNAGEPPPQWPWDAKWWKPKDYVYDLVRAGALIAAELDRVLRIMEKGDYE